MEESITKFMDESAKRHDENSNLIKEIRAATDAAIRNQGASIKTLEIQIGQLRKVLQERGSGSLPGSTKTHPRDHVNSISTTFETKIPLIRYFVVLDMPEDIKVPLILGRPLLSTAHAKIDVFKRKIALKIGNEKIMFQREALILNRSLNHVYEDYIDLNVLNELLELRRNHVDDLGPTIEDGEVINEPMIEETKTRNYDEENNGINEYPSFYDIDRKIRIDGAYNLQFLCMIGFEHVNTNFFSVLSINIMSKKFFNAIIRDKILFKGKNVVGAFVNVPIFIGNFYVITDFAVLENIDAYRDEGMGDIIVGKPFCREVCIKGRRFDGMITIYNGNDSVTYQMS
ncbi:putative reverse transcriptase domain-containing protein [Tanacetum coccineum]